MKAFWTKEQTIDFNPLTSKSDQHLISPFNITTWSNIQATTIKEMIIKDEMSWCSNKLSQHDHKRDQENSEENTRVDICA